MITLASYLLTALAAVLAVPSAIFSIEVFAALFLARRLETPATTGAERRGQIAVLIPAHNEASGLLPTLEDIKAQLRPTDRLLVVADNCTDDTAAIASSAGTEVTARNDPTKIGKGYALDWGVKYLSADAPEIVVVIDADCRVKPKAIDFLAIATVKAQRPVQALYLMTAPAGGQVNQQVAEFAWRLKNCIRPRGLTAVSSPCQLMGTGMAFPWHVIQAAALASDSIVEDLKLGVELACAGYPALFCSSAVVTSTFPKSAEGVLKQRQRWEHGHVWLIFTKVPELLRATVKRRDPRVIALMLDLLIPPLSLLVAILVCSVAIGVGAIMVGISSMPLIISLSSLMTVFAALGLAWFRFGRDILPAKSFGLLARYVAEKLRIYSGVLLGRHVSSWTRADRG
jgi:cellulose synthase/poly-beta-1,6-N-acetylglucosamine synthase-like glycosyltransferase